VRRGAYFSFSPYFLHERKAAQREAFAAIPLNRLLVETDAPDLRPPDGANPRPLIGSDGNPANHPANIDVSYRGLAISVAWRSPT
jgi:TatD DNase family protein